MSGEEDKEVTQKITDIEYQKEISKKTSKCSVHPREEIRAFCKNDFTAICFRCYLDRHKNHDVVMIDDISASDLMHKISEFEGELQNQTSTISSLSDKISQSKYNYDSQFTILKTAFDELVGMCLNGNLSQEVLGEFEERKGEVSTMHHQMIELKKSIEIIETDITTLKENAADLSVYEGIKARLTSNYESLRKIQKNLVNKNLKLANLENLDIKKCIIDTMKNLLFKKEYLNNSCIIHYFEWGSKNAIFYDCQKKTITKHTLNIDMNIPKFCRTVATEDGRVFVLGGRDRANVCCDWTLEYKDDTKTLVPRKPMLLKRSDFTPVFCRSGHIYVIGGNDAKIFYKQCEVYDIENDRWMRIANLNIGRDSSASCIFNDRFIYAFSGRTKFDKKEITNTIEKYTITSDIWELVEIAPNSTWTPCDLGMAYQLDSNSILMFGGFDKDVRTHETCIFNTTTNHIERGPYLPREGSFSNFVFHFANSLYIIGWNNSGKNMYQYLIPERIWKIDENLIL